MSEHHVNIWTAKLSLPLDEFNKYGEEFLQDGILGWKPNKIILSGDQAILMFPAQKNLVVNTGINRSLDRLFGIGGPPAAPSTIGVDDGASNPVAGTTSSSAGSTNRRLVSFGTPSRTNQVVTASGTFTKTGGAASNFVHKRLFISAAAAGTTDASGDLAAMTNVFTIDLTGFSDFSQTYSLTYTGAGS